LVVDETSMVDVMLMEALLKAVPNHAAPPARGLNEKIIPLKRWHGLVDPLKIKELPHVQRDVSSLCTSKFESDGVSHPVGLANAQACPGRDLLLVHADAGPLIAFYPPGADPQWVASVPVGESSSNFRSGNADLRGSDRGSPTTYTWHAVTSPRMRNGSTVAKAPAP
jgi:hypothetical protein